MSYSSVILADTPVGYWPLNEASGTTANDINGGTAHNGTYGGTFTLGNAGLLVGSTDTCVNLTSTSAGVSASSFPGLGNSSWSVEVWCNISSFSGQWATLVEGWDGNWSTYLNPGGSLNKIQVKNSNGSTTPTLSVTLATGTLYHIVVTYSSSGSAINMYVNNSNVLSNSTLAVGTTAGTGAELSGNRDNSNLEGKFQEWAIYNYALTSTQVGNHYTAGTTPLPSGPPLGPPIVYGQAMKRASYF